MEDALFIIWATAAVLVGGGLCVFALLIVLRLFRMMGRDAMDDRAREAARRLAEIMTATARTTETATPFILSERRQRRYENVGLSMIEDVRGPDRAALVDALRKLGTQERARVSMSDESVPKRLLAARTLGLFGDSPAIDALNGALDDPVLSVRLAAASQLLRHGAAPPKNELARRLMRDGNTQITLPENAPDGLSVTDITLVAQEIFATTDGNKPDTGDTASVADGFTDPDWRVRVHAAREAVNHGGTEHRSKLEDLQVDPVWPVREAAAASLKALDPKAEAS